MADVVVHVNPLLAADRENSNVENNRPQVIIAGWRLMPYRPTSLCAL
ncbi:hypothetical protein CIT292_08941 [Citrobacter youngae ATCC 29220]|uniref:Uncharacterized protein n=1 Tax=Citrobacter youngae ATCC 29220 TaxID=500640 RepID=D4BEK9_9ENTR|nr:hypothetical protein CIT292_08941 [Citrobacter youngae ATCC 29220]